MSRAGKVTRIATQPDAVYGDKTVAKLINRSMRSGKRAAAQKQVYGAFAIIKEKLNQDPLMVFRQALENVKPQMEVRPRRIGGAAYQVPMPVRGDRRESLAVRWIVLSAQKRSSAEFHSFAGKLAAELMDAYNNAGGAIKKKEDTHRMAEANKAFAHFRW